jgi:hypothetical protein
VAPMGGTVTAPRASVARGPSTSQRPDRAHRVRRVCPETTALATAVQVVGRRWTIAQGCEEAQGEGGLEPEEVRSWTGWSRPITLALWAYALLTVLRAVHLPAAPP